MCRGDVMQNDRNDLISRQQALDAINSWRGRFSEEYNEAIDDCENSIKELPTIQPEVLACGNGELVAKPEPQWIPIERELPRDGSWNIFTDGKNISVERYKADAIDHFFPNGRWFELEDVIAWMPLPTPYQKGATP